MHWNNLTRVLIRNIDISIGLKGLQGPIVETELDIYFATHWPYAFQNKHLTLVIKGNIGHK
jgi:hypothetical protein